MSDAEKVYVPEGPYAMIAEIARLRAINAELLAALKSATEAHNQNWFPCIEVDAAIRKAEGL